MTDVKLDLDLAQQSLVFIFASMVVYTVSFLIFAWHLTNIASDKTSGRATSSKLENIGFALFAFGAVIHGAGVVMRGIAAARVPWANMYEFSISGAFVLVAIYLAFYRLRDIRIIAAFLNGFVLLILGAATTYFYVQVQTLMPALQSYWLVIHVTVAVLATAFSISQRLFRSLTCFAHRLALLARPRSSLLARVAFSISSQPRKPSSGSKFASTELA